MNCPKCYATVDDKANFCPNCGHPLKASDTRSPTASFSHPTRVAPGAESAPSSTHEVRLPQEPTKTRISGAAQPSAGSGKTMVYGFGQQRPVRRRLHLIWREDGVGGEKSIVIEHKSSIGRDQGDIQTNDPFMSNAHAEITLDENGFYLTDLSSSNGIFMRLTGKIELKEGMQLLMGKQQFVIKTIDEIKE